MEAAVSADRLLLVVDGAQTSTHLLPAWGDVLIGRDPECRIVINHPAVSPHHARISVSAEHLTIEDLGTPGGTVLRDRTLAPRVATPRPAERPSRSARRC
jgi:hypothetical protein